MKTKHKYLIIGIIFTVALGIDLITKHLFCDTAYTRIIPYLIAFQSNGGNTGAAFGIFSESTTFLIISSIIIVVAMIFVDLIMKVKSRTYIIGFALILAGAVGNFVDRIMLGYVRDFIMFDFWKTFPIFNFADCCVVVGAILVAVHFIFLSKADDNGTN